MDVVTAPGAQPGADVTASAESTPTLALLAGARAAAGVRRGRVRPTPIGVAVR